VAGEFTHIEIPADDTGKAGEFGGALLGWEFSEVPGPSEYHMTQTGERQSPP
jgi:predicted enzyme related to lactoylglutathione lyase